MQVLPDDHRTGTPCANRLDFNRLRKYPVPGGEGRLQLLETSVHHRGADGHGDAR